MGVIADRRLDFLGIGFGRGFRRGWICKLSIGFESLQLGLAFLVIENFRHFLVKVVDREDE